MRGESCIRNLALATSLVVLAACGGGGGEPAGPTATLSAASVAEVEFRSYTLVNDSRREQQVQPELDLEALLSAIARAHSEGMRDQGFYAHRDPQGRTVSARLREAGVNFSQAGENIALVDQAIDPAGLAHSDLMASDGHRANILDDGFQVIGVGVARAGDTYWITQVFISL